jgi:hypothetical protein
MVELDDPVLRFFPAARVTTGRTDFNRSTDIS